MKLGLLADVHEDAHRLRLALDRLWREGVDQLVVLGDVVETGGRLSEVTAMLADAGAVGVWGNHDLGLCHEPEADLLARYDRPATDYLRTLRPRLEVAGCLFVHGLPSWDPADPAVYYTGDRPETQAGLAGCFTACPHPAVFVGHFHRWLAGTPAGLTDWRGGGPLRLDPDRRWLVAVAAVCDGWCATFDTDGRRLTPLQLSPGARQSSYRDG